MLWLLFINSFELCITDNIRAFFHQVGTILRPGKHQTNLGNQRKTRSSDDCAQNYVSHHPLSSGLRGRKMAAIDGKGLLLRF